MSIEELQNEIRSTETLIDEAEMEQQEVMEARDECGVWDDEGNLAINNIPEQVAFQVLNEQFEEIADKLEFLYAFQEDLEERLRNALKREKRHLLRSLLRSRINAQ